MQQLDTPNLKIPLACSYNTRGQNALSNIAIDQQKINSMYRPIKNAMTGKVTLLLCRRYGVTDSGDTFGTTGQVAYLISPAAGNNAISARPWVYSVSGNDVRASDTAGTTVIVSAAGYLPAYVDKTSISGVDTVVLQLRNASGTQTVWYATVIGTWAQISDGDFTGLTIKGKMEFLDGWTFALDSLNRIYNSDINSLANWTAGQYITKQIQQDVPLGLARLNQQILAFGEETVEVFVNNGNPSGSPLVTVPSLQARVGLINPRQTNTGQTHYYAVLKKSLYFVGRIAGNATSKSLIVYNGQTFESVSNPTIDAILQSSANYSVNVVAFAGQNAIAIGIDATTATTQRWLMFFPEWNDWFEWISTVFTPVNCGMFFLGVGANQHKSYYLGADTGSEKWQDDSTNVQVTHQFKMPKDDNARAFMTMCGVIGDTTRSASTLNVEFSDDDGQNWQTARAIDMTQVTKKHLYRCGSYTERLVRLTNTANLDLRLEQFIARIE